MQKILNKTATMKQFMDKLREATQQEVTLIASVPLTAEAWRPLEEGEIVVLRDGAIVERRAS